MTHLLRAPRILPFFVTFLLAQFATADDELLLYVFDGGNGVEGAEVVVDGTSVGTTRADGSLTADLSDGAHVVAVAGPEGKTAVARFTAGNGLLANVVANLEDASTRIQVFARTESAEDRRDAPTGTMIITVRKGANVAANQLVVFSLAVLVRSTPTHRARRPRHCPAGCIPFRWATSRDVCVWSLA